MEHEKHVSLLSHKINIFTVQTQIIDGLCYFLVVLGLIGNILGLFIFTSSRRTWQVSSLYVYLATSSSIINVFCVIRYAFVLHSQLRTLLSESVGQKWWTCKIYELSFSFRVISSYITLFWMFERLLHVSMRLQSIFNRCHSYRLTFILPLGILIVLLGSIIGPPVYMFRPQKFNYTRLDSRMVRTETYCGLDFNASPVWKRYFHEIHFGFNHFTIRCLFSELIPTSIVILFDCYVIYYVLRVHRCLHQSNDRRLRTISWMNTVLFLHSLLFLSSLVSHIIGHFTNTEPHEGWWVLLTILINSSLNFYVYCLSGKAFRKEIYQFTQRLKTQFLHHLHIQQHECDRVQTWTNAMHNSQVIIGLNTHYLHDGHESLVSS